MRLYIPGATDAEADYAWLFIAEGLFTRAEFAEQTLAEWCAPYADPVEALRRKREREWREAR